MPDGEITFFPMAEPRETVALCPSRERAWDAGNAAIAAQEQ